MQEAIAEIINETWARDMVMNKITITAMDALKVGINITKNAKRIAVRDVGMDMDMDMETAGEKIMAGDVGTEIN
jgi:hypothetical protein